MHERKKLMYDLSDGFVALPGGLGTLEELAEVATWSQLGLHRKAAGSVGRLGFLGSAGRVVGSDGERRVAEAVT